MKQKGKATKIVILVLIVLSFATLTIIFFPMAAALLKPDGQAKFCTWMERFGAWSWLILLLIQIGQIIIAFIPGEPVEIVSGILYGTFGGLLLCLIGLLIGSAITFLLARKFGTPLIKAIFSEKQLSRFKILQNAQKGKTVSFLLFLIPGTPKDLLTYVAGLTSVKLPGFLFVSVLARIPCVVCSTYAGDSIMEGRYGLAAAVFGVMALVTLPGFLFYRRYAANSSHEETEQPVNYPPGDK